MPGKRACPVLRGLRRSNAPELPDSSPHTPPAAATRWWTGISTFPSPGPTTASAAEPPGSPTKRTFATKGELDRTMITHALASPLPIAWITPDSAYGQDSHFRRFFEDARVSYVVTVPKSQQIHDPRIDHLIAQAPRGLTPAVRRSRRQGRAPLRLGRRPPARRLGVRRCRTDPPAMDAGPPKHHQAC
ncbi:transposase [Streptomyces halstedii]|uniref:transposase n=1 Tax=Streptomyces halstedii TaxID=1944 RepID=UPI0038223D89